ncbi:hypothetical protein GLA29479_1228 [Lysobacter antibioticus]|nr:hypothetical protein GLA29479_1228 [Lysobacter antibioticus]
MLGALDGTSHRRCTGSTAPVRAGRERAAGTFIVTGPIAGPSLRRG